MHAVSVLDTELLQACKAGASDRVIAALDAGANINAVMVCV
jgi:hypothetical protein